MRQENLKNLCTKKCYLCDPLIFAHKINPEKVLMLNSRIDHFFSKKSSLMLWEELGRPEIHWFNYFHLSRILNKKLILKNITSFLKKSKIIRFSYLRSFLPPKPYLFIMIFPRKVYLFSIAPLGQPSEQQKHLLHLL